MKTQNLGIQHSNYKKTVSNMLVVSLLLVSAFASAEDNDLREVSCSQFNLPTTEQCFNGPRFYLGKALHSISSSMTNKGELPLYIFNTDPKGNSGIIVKQKPLQGTSWHMPEFTHAIPADLKLKSWYFRQIDPGETRQIVENKPDTELVFVKIGQNTDRNKPVFQLSITTTAYGSMIINEKLYPNGKDINTTTNHAFYYGAWCGDGVIDKDFGETCDFKDPAQENWGTKGCTNTCKAL